MIVRFLEYDSAFHKGRSAEKREELEESKGRRGGMCGQATRSATRMEEEFSSRIEKESGGALWKGRSRRGAIIRT